MLANFIATHHDAIISLFTERVQATLAPAKLTRSELVDHLPSYLRELSAMLARDPASPVGSVFSRSVSAEEHGGQRLRLGYDLNALVREYGLLRDCILQRLEEENATPSMHDLRVLSDCLSAATADSVNRFVEERQRGLADEQHNLLGLFEQAPGFVCFLRGPDLVFDLANTAYFQLVGHREILGKTVREALPEVEGQGYFELVEKVYATGEPFVGRGMKVALQREPGAPLTEAFIDLIFQPINGADGHVSGILVQGNEVTDVRRAEERRIEMEAALRASEVRYRTLFESIDDGFCLLQMIFDEAGRPVDYRFLEANVAFEGHTGLHDAVGKRVLELVPDLDSSWMDRYGAVATTGEPSRFEDHAPAMNRWFEAYASRVGAPELRQVAVVFKDVTARKRAEEERERLFDLEREARHEAEEASRLKDEFLATVSHELRTPLNSMLGWVQMLRGGGLPADKRERALETVERNARAQAQLIEDLLDVSRILAGKLRLEVEVIEVQAVVEAALETVRPAADAKGIRLFATLSSLATVMGDPHRLQQIVWNLLSNAVKFTTKGGRVQVVVEQRDSAVLISVADTGAGIAKDFQPHVFERFRQGEGGTTRSHGGLGLGLSIVRQLVELHGGTVTVFSEGEGHGSTFTVQLPVAVAKRRDVSSSPGLPVMGGMLGKGVTCPPELAGLRILVVDDEEDSREMLRTMLEGCGAEVAVAASAEEALALFATQRPGVLLSDIGMPGQDGYALIAKVRALPSGAGGNVPAVALTAYARSEDRTRALLSGFNNHVPKPVEPLELLAAIASLSRGR